MVSGTSKARCVAATTSQSCKYCASWSRVESLAIEQMQLPSSSSLVTVLIFLVATLKRSGAQNWMGPRSDQVRQEGSGFPFSNGNLRVSPEKIHGRVVARKLGACPGLLWVSPLKPRPSETKGAARAFKVLLLLPAAGGTKVRESEYSRP